MTEDYYSMQNDHEDINFTILSMIIVYANLVLLANSLHIILLQVMMSGSIMVHYWKH